jgi:hypothetical protein
MRFGGIDIHRLSVNGCATIQGNEPTSTMEKECIAAHDQSG